MSPHRFKVVVSCRGIPEEKGRAGVADIIEEFQQRPWHDKASCVWEDGRLVLTAENDFDSDGKALAHEFSDAICACIAGTFDSEVRVESVTHDPPKA